MSLLAVAVLIVWLLICIILYIIAEKFINGTPNTTPTQKWVISLLVAILLIILFVAKSGILSL